MILKLSGVVAVELVIYALLRQYKPEYAVLSEVACAGIVFFMIAGELEEIRGFFSAAMESAGVDVSYAGVLLKVLGTALISQFAADAARDNGQGALAEKIEFAGKVLILLFALPVLKAILQLIAAFSGNV